ncbi:MAG: energy-coupling factor transporter transmembrane component T family protein [Anaerolineae bacterium]
MGSYHALRHVSIGQYIPMGSVVHRLDPRIKLVSFVLLVACTVITKSYGGNLALLGIIVAAVLAARLPLGYVLRGLRPALPFIVVLSLLQLAFYNSAAVAPDTITLIQWGPITITTASVQAVIVALIRFLGLLFLTSLLTNTTTTGALTHGIEHLLRPLTWIGLPGHEMALIATIALRFAPILGEQAEAILMAQASRTVTPERSGAWRLIDSATRGARLVVPLFVDAYRRSEELALAMQARCYQGGRGRTQLNTLRLARRDATALLLVLTVFVAALLSRWIAVA